jgi:broad specificity phosphatase PhoE
MFVTYLAVMSNRKEIVGEEELVQLGRRMLELKDRARERTKAQAMVVVPVDHEAAVKAMVAALAGELARGAPEGLALVRGSRVVFGLSGGGGRGCPAGTDLDQG